MTDEMIAYALKNSRPPHMTNEGVQDAIIAGLRAHKTYHPTDPHPNCVFCKYGKGA